jgi:hypothetical protein
MKDYRDKLAEIGRKFNVDITPENVDDVLRNTWEKYHRTGKRN